MKKEISVIIPTYNEADNIKEMVTRLAHSFIKNKFKYQIIVIDDNSTDGTLRIVRKLKKDFSLEIYSKKGTQGKAFSLVEGFSKVKYANVAFIDGDLQYAPEEIVLMAGKLRAADVVIANRSRYQDSRLRKLLSRTFRVGFGKMLFGLNHDIQAGLKVFKRTVIDEISFTPSSSWTFDLEFLHKAREAGFVIADHDITFSERKRGNSKVGLTRAVYEIGTSAVALKLRQTHPKHIEAPNKKSMRGAGMKFKRSQYVTHTTLHHSKSSVTTFTIYQRFLMVYVVEILVVGLIINPLATLGIVIGLLSFIYFADTVFNLFVVLKSLRKPQEITVSDRRLRLLKDKNLPIYTILCPLYKEAHIIPQFVENISKLSWPSAKLDVMLLLEEDDVESIAAAKKMNLPSFVRVVVVPDSQPKTKPKACNYGLSFAKGDYLVIFDAEDMPEPMQLKKAYAAFQDLPRDVVCLQAKLNYYNPSQNLLTRFFTAEYSLWFDVTLTGLQSIGTTIPLGGTSNHFRTADLHMLEGWDPFNVTEDADLGMRLFKDGYKTAIIDSTTLEEANSKWGNWIRQRSRWIKGYMQTYLVHTRKTLDFAKNKKHHYPIFHLIIGGKIAFILINPLLWVATISYFTLYAFVGPAIERLYPSIVFYMAVFSLVFGNFLFMYYYMIGVMKRQHYSLIKYVFLIPIYWLMISVAGFMALHQLFFKPFYWEKTVHGLHLLEGNKKKSKRSWIKLPAINIPGLPVPAVQLFSKAVVYPLIVIGTVEKAVVKASTSALIVIGEVEKRGFVIAVTGFKKLILVPIRTAMSLFV